MGVLVSAHARSTPWYVVESVEGSQTIEPYVFVQPLLQPAPRVDHVWVEPGRTLPVRRCPADLVYCVLRGATVIGGHLLEPESVLFVPKQTPHGSEWTGDQGVLMLRVELWDVDAGRPSDTEPDGNVAAVWKGAMRDGDVPVPQGSPGRVLGRPPTRTPSKELVASSLRAKQWGEAIRKLPGGKTSEGQLFVRSGFATAPSVVEIHHRPHFVQRRHQHEIDEIFYITQGGEEIDGHELRVGSVFFVPKHTPYGPENTGAKGTTYIRVVLEDSEITRGKARVAMPVDPAMLPRPWTGPLTVDGLPNPVAA